MAFTRIANIIEYPLANSSFNDVLHGFNERNIAIKQFDGEGGQGDVSQVTLRERALGETCLDMFLQAGLPEDGDVTYVGLQSCLERTALGYLRPGVSVVQDGLNLIVPSYENWGISAFFDDAGMFDLENHIEGWRRVKNWTNGPEWPPEPGAMGDNYVGGIAEEGDVFGLWLTLDMRKAITAMRDTWHTNIIFTDRTRYTTQGEGTSLAAAKTDALNNIQSQPQPDSTDWDRLVLSIAASGSSTSPGEITYRVGGTIYGGTFRFRRPVYNTMHGTGTAYAIIEDTDLGNTMSTHTGSWGGLGFDWNFSDGYMSFAEAFDRINDGGANTRYDRQIFFGRQDRAGVRTQWSFQYTDDTNDGA